MATISISAAFDTVNKSRSEIIGRILEELGHKVLVGSDLNGEQISTTIQEKIEHSDGLVAIFSKRDQLQNGGWSTHPWVIERLFGRLKDWRRIAIRYDRCAHTFYSAICLAATVIFWLRVLSLSY